MSFRSRISAASSVPSAYVGLWKRSYIQRRNCSIDSSTQAWWFQSPRLHIDLRIPSDRPKLTSAHSVTQLSTQEWGRFTAQTSFAGLTLVNADQCEWHPEIAFPVLATEPDVGIIRFDALNHIHEAGIDGSYEEEWLKIDTGPVLGLRLQNMDEVAYVLVSENWIAWAQGIPQIPGEPSAALSRSDSWSTASFATKASGESKDWMIIASIKSWTEGSVFSSALIPSINVLIHLKVGDMLSIPSSEQAMCITHIDRQYSEQLAHQTRKYELS